MKVHAIAALFPMMSADELKALAEDIKVQGQLQPIVVHQDEILDGRNRYAACELAGVEPRFEQYEGDDPVGYIMAANMARRNMSKGQRAMIIAQARLVSKQTMREAAGQHGISAARISQAAMVIKYRENLVGAVVKGYMSLDDAYGQAQACKAQAEEAERLLAQLRDVAPDLADRVIDGELTVREADKMWRDNETLRTKKERAAVQTATDSLNSHIPSVAYWCNNLATRYAQNYNPNDARLGKVNKQMLVDARKAIDNIIAVWDERRLP
jgi:hypothetical protein